MNQIFDRMGDADGNFVDDFQGPGFHTRLFELAVFAYLEENRFTIKRGSPDFIVAKEGTRLAIEAVTSNSTDGRSLDIALSQLADPWAEDPLAKANDDFPIRISNALTRKLDKQYWSLPACRGLPLVLFIGPFHEPGSTTYIDESLARFLYGVERYPGWLLRNGLLVREVPVASHSFGGKTVRSNFFGREGAEEISAVIWCNQFTVPRFFRIASQANGLPSGVHAVEVSGFCIEEGADLDQAAEYRYRLGPDAPTEFWSRGVTVLFNPRARFKLPHKALSATSSFDVELGRLRRRTNSFHTLTSMMMVSQGGP